MGDCFCFECHEPIDCEADTCPSCGASQTNGFSKVFKRLIKRAAIVVGSIILAVFLRAGIEVAFKNFDLQEKYGISNEIIFFVLLGVVVVVVAVIVIVRNRKGDESRLNLKD